MSIHLNTATASSHIASEKKGTAGIGVQYQKVQNTSPVTLNTNSS